MHEDQTETTGYSISATPPQEPERRADERFVRVLRVGAISIDDRRELCLIRNISAGGMMIRAYSALAVGETVSIDFKQGESIPGLVHWVRDELTGIRFNEPIDVVGLLANDATGPQPRLPRIELECSAWVRQEARLSRAFVINISQGGMCVRSSAELEVAGDIVVTLPGLAPAAGVVRWARNGCYGIAFNRRLALPELVDWLKERQVREQERLAS